MYHLSSLAVVFLNFMRISLPHLVQMVSKPTRGENILDLFLTSNYTLVNIVDVKPGISDHDLVLSEVFTKPVETRQPPRSAYLYRKADWGGFQTYMEKVKEDVLASATSKSVEELWISFKSSINEGTSWQRSGKGAIRKRFPLQKTEVGKTKLTIRYLYHENIS